MKTKNIQFILDPPETHWVGNGFKVHKFIPGVPELSMQAMDPFVLLDYNAPMHVSPSDTPKGVGPHPHRGFETVTIAYKGKIEQPRQQRWRRYYWRRRCAMDDCRRRNTAQGISRKGVEQTRRHISDGAVVDKSSCKRQNGSAQLSGYSTFDDGTF